MRLIKIAATLFFIVFILFFSLRFYLYPNLPKYEGKVFLNGLKKSVEVFTDKYGVPHVFAKNERDLFFAAGYIAARERLFQMSMVALAVRGELSSALGDEYLSSDIYLRTWGIPTIANRLVEIMDEEERLVLESFCEGINEHIRETMHDLPIEFKILRINPPIWKPSDVTGYARMMAHEMQGSWKAEIVYGAVADYFGEEKLKEIYPGNDFDVPMITKGLKPAFDSILENELKIRDFLGFRSSHFGSNSWVLSGEKTKNKKPILANDPHLEFSQPARWYEMHLKGGKYNSSGVCIAGIPVPIIGSNGVCAWGFTNSMVDDVDFFIETINDNNPDQYLHGDEWKNIKLITQKVPRRNGQDTSITIRHTHHGPIISDIHPLLKNKKKVVSFSWSGHKETREMNAFMKLNTMKSWDDFTSAVKNFGVPGQNIIYADTMGNIGWRPAVYIPIRKKGSSLIPRPGEDPTYDWEGYVPFEEMPFIYNPEKGFIVTANNKTIGNNFPYYISGLWADPSRAQRINDLIEPITRGTVGEMKKIQTDLVSPFAKTILSHLFKYNFEYKNETFKKHIDSLKNWNGEENKDSEDALFYHSILRSLIINIYGDELSALGDNYLEAFLGLKYLYTRNLRQILKDGTSSWFDNIKTKDYIETDKDIIKKSITDGISYAIDTFGKKKSNLKWGEAHTLTHNHLLGNVGILNSLFGFNVGPFLSGGSDKTVRAGGFSYVEPFKQSAGASMRRIVDLSKIEEINFILPTGQSGHPHSQHYSDQAKLYNDGKYKKTIINENKIREGKHKKLQLIPAE